MSSEKKNQSSLDIPPSSFIIYSLSLSFRHIAATPQIYISYFSYYKKPFKKPKFHYLSMTEQCPQTSSYVAPLASDQPPSFVVPTTHLLELFCSKGDSEGGAMSPMFI